VKESPLASAARAPKQASICKAGAPSRPCIDTERNEGVISITTADLCSVLVSGVLYMVTVRAKPRGSSLPDDNTHAATVCGATTNNGSGVCVVWFG
jgi:FAD/FMN-containing dehydrogenase